MILVLELAFKFYIFECKYYRSMRRDEKSNTEINPPDFHDKDFSLMLYIPPSMISWILNPATIPPYQMRPQNAPNIFRKISSL